MDAEFVICVKGLPEGLRKKFFDGFTAAFENSVAPFVPPYEYEIRPITDPEREALKSCRVPPP